MLDDNAARIRVLTQLATVLPPPEELNSLHQQAWTDPGFENVPGAFHYLRREHLEQSRALLVDKLNRMGHAVEVAEESFVPGDLLVMMGRSWYSLSASDNAAMRIVLVQFAPTFARIDRISMDEEKRSREVPGLLTRNIDMQLVLQRRACDRYLNRRNIYIGSDTMTRRTQQRDACDLQLSFPWTINNVNVFEHKPHIALMTHESFLKHYREAENDLQHAMICHVDASQTPSLPEYAPDKLYHLGPMTLKPVLSWLDVDSKEESRGLTHFGAQGHYFLEFVFVTSGAADAYVANANYSDPMATFQMRKGTSLPLSKCPTLK